MADPQRVRIQPHTRHSRESAHLAPARESTRCSVAQAHAPLPPNPAHPGPRAQHRELVVAMVAQPTPGMRSTTHRSLRLPRSQVCGHGTGS
ncbi:hypothetical protein B0H11DRAFT_2254312 [Mycena galericulata]|nr:hypothetical protein B0H11DRAFT_2254312 [Mycena galericulata]